MTDDVRFVEETHQYFINNVEYPPVSTVTGFFTDYSRVPRATLELKRQIGKATHKAIELYSHGELDVETVDGAVLPYLESWIRFVAVKPLKVIAAERIVYSKKHRVAGTLDLVVEFDEEPGVFWLPDAKCTYEMSAVTALQTGAYQVLWNENNEPKVTKRAGIQLKPDGSIAEFYPYDRIGNKNDFGIFLNALNCYRWARNNGITT